MAGYLFINIFFLKIFPPEKVGQGENRVRYAYYWKDKAELQNYQLEMPIRPAFDQQRI